MKNLFSLILIIISSISYGNEEKIQALIRIEKTDQKGLVTFHVQDGPQVEAIAQGKEVKEILKGLTVGDEAFVRGKIIYSQVGHLDSQSITSHFLIEDIKPVSLEKLALGPYQTPDLLIGPSLRTPLPSPQGLPISTEIASALTLTTSMLLMQNLSAPPHEPQGKADLQKAVLLSAGTLATLVFIYQQASQGLR